MNSKSLIKELANAADRGVLVSVMVSKNFNDSRVKYPFMGGSNEENIKLLTRITSQSENIRIRYFQNPDRELFSPIPEGNPKGVSGGNGINHAKYLSVDGELTIVGSANMDNVINLAIIYFA